MHTIRSGKRARKRKTARRVREKIVLRRKIKLGSRRRKKSRRPPAIIRVLGSGKLTLGLATVLGSLAFPGAALGLVRGAGALIKPKSIKGAIGLFVGLPVAGGLLTSKFIRGFIDPRKSFKRGKRGAEILEDPKSFLGKRPGLVEAFKTAGVVGLGVTALGGGVLLTKKAIKALRGRRDRITITGPAIPQAPEFFPQIIPTPSGQVAGLEDPLGAVKPMVEKAPTMRRAPRRRAKMPSPITNIIQIQNTIGI